MQGGYAGDWFLQTWPVCATQPAGWDLVTALDNGVGTASFTCPAGKKPTGAGAYISLSLGKIFLRDVAVTPLAGDATKPAGVSVVTNWVDSGYTHDWYSKAYGICVS